YQATGGRITLPRTSQLQATEGKAVARGDLRPGDLIAFQMRSPSYDHIAIYAGSGQIIHAPGTGKVVRLEPLATYDAKPQTIRRIS
ncbi:C40 family peptidase, partial [Streptomyces albidoflavus]